MKTYQLLFWVVAVAGGGQYCFAAGTPDPIILLQGVESARTQIPPSVLHIRCNNQSPMASSAGENLVVFDGDHRLVSRTNMPSEKRKFMYNGSEVFQCDASDVMIADFGPRTPGTLADPRLLGITCTYIAVETLGMALPYRDASKVELVGREQIGDKGAWHVRILHEPDTQRDFWIDERNGFRVLRRDEKQNGVLNRSTRSYYENPDYTWLPSKVETESFNVEGQPDSKSQRWILNAKAGVKIPPSTWTLTGLQIPVNARVNDQRSNVFLGYWDGQAVVPNAQLVPLSQPVKPTRLLVPAILVALVAVPIVIYLRSQAKHRRNL